ncbi:hypothetical protein Kpho02_48420 [Kitasatospora phosalacinea]|uniref:Leucine rich repeat variant n=1 Tax=Kitasatospora phosalacinea TaxID=2065 RepID=A0A9W6V3T6_9ACTN|nr:hypothetical protein [Kitasatospora phosalacinea]GLW72543.1 hypothetical protein Kpho02_48420 [Kitasatospora phosalacinea]
MPDVPYDFLGGLAENPVLPADLVDRLVAAPHRSYTLAKRPDLTEAQLDVLIARNAHAVALNRHLPPQVRRRLAAHPDPSVRTALIVSATDSDEDRELFERFATDPAPEVRKQLAESDRTPADLRTRLAHDPDPEVRATLAQWWTTAPEPVRRALLTDPEDSVRAAACATYFPRLPHPVPPADLLPALLADPLTRAGAAVHCDPASTDLERLAADPDPEVRRALAAHPGLPAHLRARLAADPRARIRLTVLARPDTPAAERAALHASVTGPFEPPGADVDEETAIELEIDHIGAGIELWMLQLPWVTADPLPHLDSPYPVFRRAAAASPDLPAEARARLLADPDNEVALAAARSSPDPIDPVTAERLDREHRPAKRMRWRPADAFPLPVETLRRLADDPVPRMRLLALRDPDLPAHLLERLATDPEDHVRAAAASHPAHTPATLRALLDDPSPSVQRAAAANPALPAEEIRARLDAAGL